MKKYLTKTIFFVLAMVTIFSLVACNNQLEYEKVRESLYAYVLEGEFKEVTQQGEPFIYVVQKDDDELTIDNIDATRGILYLSYIYYYHFLITAVLKRYDDVIMIFEDYELDEDNNIVYENIIYERK